MYNPMSLENKNIIVTGGASGIGKAAAIEISKLGGNVLLVDIDEMGMKQTLSSCSDSSRGEVIDLQDNEAIADTLKSEAKIMGKFDGLVHCAGVPSVVPLRMLNSDNYKKVMEINTFAAIELVRNFVSKKVCAASGGSIVLISSVYGVVGSACNLAYTASKAAIIGITKSLGIELASKNIRVNCVAPGFIKTNMAEDVELKFDKSYSEVIESLHPLGWGEAQDIAMGIAFLLSNASKWMTGAVLNIDGGYTAQ